MLLESKQLLEEIRLEIERLNAAIVTFKHGLYGKQANVEEAQHLLDLMIDLETQKDGQKDVSKHQLKIKEELYNNLKKIGLPSVSIQVDEIIYKVSAADQFTTNPLTGNSRVSGGDIKYSPIN